MSVAALYVEPETNPLLGRHGSRWTLTSTTLSAPSPLLPLDADGTAAVRVGTPFDGRVGVDKVAEIKTGVLLIERPWD